jgi:hypothetical protein
MMDPHVILVCVFTVAFLFVVSGLGDRPRKKTPTYRRRPAVRKPVEQWKRKPLPRPKRR